MTLRTGNRPTSDRNGESHPTRTQRRSASGRSEGFTLIELILVMTMMVIVLSVVSPSLSRFFRGRTLDSEARRFLALTRYGQSRAVADGVPMLLWIDPIQGAYGLQADSSYVEQDSKLVDYKLNADIQVQVEESPEARRIGSLWKGNHRLATQVMNIRFSPDGFIGQSSPERIIFHGKDEGVIGVGESWDRLRYEIQTNQFQRFYRDVR